MHSFNLVPRKFILSRIHPVHLRCWKDYEGKNIPLITQWRTYCDISIKHDKFTQKSIEKFFKQNKSDIRQEFIPHFAERGKYIHLP